MVHILMREVCTELHDMVVGGGNCNVMFGLCLKVIFFLLGQIPRMYGNMRV